MLNAMLAPLAALRWSLRSGRLSKGWSMGKSKAQKRRKRRKRDPNRPRMTVTAASAVHFGGRIHWGLGVYFTPSRAAKLIESLRKWPEWEDDFR